MSTLPLQTGFQFAERGMAHALAHAESVDDGWGEKAYQFVRGFAAQRTQFRTEEVRAYAEQRGLMAPPSARAWGGIIGRAVKAGLIISVGYVNCSNPSAHRCPVRVWQGV